MKLIDITNKVFGRWTVIKRMPDSKYKDKKWLCKCICGTERELFVNSLKNGSSKSCGCLMRELRFVNLTGRKYGRWTVLELTERKGIKRSEITYLCRCECGIEKAVCASSLRTGGSQSCGCLWSEKVHNLTGPKSTNWKGGNTKVYEGYILLYKPDHPNAFRHCYVREHVYVMSEYIGRPLFKNETVHHKNGIKNDNRIENLELFASNHCPGQRVTDLIIYAKEILAKYNYLEIKFK